MPTVRSRITFSNIVAVIALFVALGGGAYAATDPFLGNAGGIQGCVQDGVLHVVKAGKRCPKRTTSLIFSQTGKQGKQGIQGIQGTAGTPGAAAAYYDYNSGGGGEGIPIPLGATNAAVVASKSLPAGDYSVTGKVALSAADTQASTTVLVQCGLVDLPAGQNPPLADDYGTWATVTSSYFPAAGASPGTPTYFAFTSLPFGIDVSSTAPTTLQLYCYDSENSNATSSFQLDAHDAEISAVQVKSIS